VTSAGGNTYSYNANGNMTGRHIASGTLAGDYTLGYDAENRLVSVTGPNGFSASFVYDGDGQRVKSTFGGVSTTFVGNHYEVTGSTVTKYYYANGQRIAMRTGSTLYYLLSDHLGSTSITTSSTGAKEAELRYTAWGEVRFTSGSTPTAYTFQGQYSNVAEFGLQYFNARWYDGSLGRWASPDSIIPQSQGVQAWDRYAFVDNNPVRYTDPSGHDICDEEGNCYSPQQGWYSLGNAPRWNTGTLRRAGYSAWEAEALSALYSEGGQERRHAVGYMVQHDVHLSFRQEVQPAAWRPGHIYLDSDKYDPGSDPTDPYMLSLIAHEAVHLEQGVLIALTIPGEVQAWQIGYTVYRTMTGRYPGNRAAATNIMSLHPSHMSAEELRNARRWMRDFDPGYNSGLLYPWDPIFIWNTYQLGPVVNFPPFMWLP
jgi:RHS repeat-associated protein